MQAVTLKDAKRNLPRLVEQILADAEPRIVVTERGGQVVVMPLDEFNSWKETLCLLGNPANAAHLRRSIAEAGQAQKRELCAERISPSHGRPETEKYDYRAGSCSLELPRP